MWEPPEYPGPCFDLHFDRFDGFIFEAEKPFENVCATGASPVQLREYLFLHLFDCKPQNIVAVVVHESATAQEAVLLDGVAAKGETVITFLELRIQKKSEKRPRKWARNSDPFLVPLSIGIFPEGSENGRILGPAFWCWRATFELIFGIAQSGRGATISSATCSRRTPKCSQLMLALNTYSFQTIKLKLAAFLPSAAPTGEAPCSAHVFEGFFGLENGPVKSDKSQEKTLFGKEMPEDASRHPKPTSYPQTRQDTVVGVFPMESSN